MYSGLAGMRSVIARAPSRPDHWVGSASPMAPMQPSFHQIHQTKPADFYHSDRDGQTLFFSYPGAPELNAR